MNTLSQQTKDLINNLQPQEQKQPSESYRFIGRSDRKSLFDMNGVLDKPQKQETVIEQERPKEQSGDPFAKYGGYSIQQAPQQPSEENDPFAKYGGYSIQQAPQQPSEEGAAIQALSDRFKQEPSNLDSSKFVRDIDINDNNRSLSDLMRQDQREAQYYQNQDKKNASISYADKIKALENKPYSQVTDYEKELIHKYYEAKKEGKLDIYGKPPETFAERSKHELAQSAKTGVEAVARVADTPATLWNIASLGVNGLAKKDVLPYAPTLEHTIDKAIDKATGNYTVIDKADQPAHEGIKSAIDTFTGGFLGKAAKAGKLGAALQKVEKPFEFIGSTKPSNIIGAGTAGYVTQNSLNNNDSPLQAIALGIGAGTAADSLAKGLGAAVKPASTLAKYGFNDLNKEVLDAAKSFGVELPAVLVSDSNIMTKLRDLLKKNPTNSSKFYAAEEQGERSFAQAFRNTVNDYIATKPKPISDAKALEDTIVKPTNLNKFVDEVGNELNFNVNNKHLSQGHEAADKIKKSISQNQDAVTNEVLNKSLDLVALDLKKDILTPYQASVEARTALNAEKQNIKNVKNQLYSEAEKHFTPETKGIPTATIDVMRNTKNKFKSWSFDTGEVFVVKEITKFLDRIGALKKDEAIQKILDTDLRGIPQSLIDANMHKIVEAIDIPQNQLKDITAEELFHTRRSLTNKIKGDKELTGAKTFIASFVNAIEQDMHNISQNTNSKAYEKIKEADKFYKDNVVDRIRTPMAQELLKSQLPKEAYTYMNTESGIMELQKLLGNGAAANEALGYLKNTKAKEIFLDRVMTDGRVNNKKFKDFFEKKDSNQGLLKALIGEQKFNDLKKVAQTEYGISLQEIGVIRTDAIRALNSADISDKSKKINQQILDETRKDLREAFKGKPEEYKNFLITEKNAVLNEKQEKFKAFFANSTDSKGNVSYESFANKVLDPKNQDYLKRITDEATFEKLTQLAKWAKGIKKDIMKGGDTSASQLVNHFFKYGYAYPVYAFYKSDPITSVASLAGIFTAQTLAGAFSRALTDPKFVNLSINYKNNPSASIASKIAQQFEIATGMSLKTFNDHLVREDDKNQKESDKPIKTEFSNRKNPQLNLMNRQPKLGDGL